jgi:polyisoprenoid-binding protein YceI
VNAATGEAQGLIAVDVDSGASGNDSRDGRMKRDLLETARYPLATFEPQKVTGFSATAATQTISVAGSFTLHGSAHPMTLQFAVTLNRAGPATTSPAAATATTSFKIPYVAWGIKDPSIPFVHVEKEVTIDIAARGTLQ